MFTLTIKTANAAFHDDADEKDDAYARDREIARILRTLAREFEDGAPPSKSVFDSNGNKVGSYSIDE